MDELSNISDYLDSLNSAFKDISDHPISVSEKDIPNNFEILLRGVSSAQGLDFLFSPKLDKILSGLFSKIENGNFEDIIANQDKIKALLNSVFGEGSFEGPVSTKVLNSIQFTMQKQKYVFMKGKMTAALRKMRMIVSDLNKGKKEFKNDPEKLQKYKDAIYAIKQVMKIAVQVYKNRSLVNRKLYNGLKNIIHEDVDFKLEGIE